MTGQGYIMYLLAKACRIESFTHSELSIGNMDCKNIVDSLDDNTSGPGLDQQILKGKNLEVGGQLANSQSQSQDCIWAHFTFACTSLAALKFLAMKNIPSDDSFTSTDDVLAGLAMRRSYKEKQDGALVK